MQAPKVSSETTKKINLAPDLYKADFYAWTQVQVLFLRNQQWSQLDLLNLIEEVEPLGKQQCQELRSDLLSR